MPVFDFYAESASLNVKNLATIREAHDLFDHSRVTFALYEDPVTEQSKIVGIVLCASNFGFNHYSLGRLYVHEGFRNLGYKGDKHTGAAGIDGIGTRLARVAVADLKQYLADNLQKTGALTLLRKYVSEHFFRRLGFITPHYNHDGDGMEKLDMIPNQTTPIKDPGSKG